MTNAQAHEAWLEANQAYLMAALKAVQEELEVARKKPEKGKPEPEVKPASRSFRFFAPRRAAVPTEKKLMLPKSSNAKEVMQQTAQKMAVPPALEQLTSIFGLSTFERKILLMCAGVELDGQFGKLIAELNGNPAQLRPSLGLALGAFADAHWSAIAPYSPLRFWRLIRYNDAELLTKSPLRIDEHILHYLTGVQYRNERLTEIMEPVYAGFELAPSQVEITSRIAEALRTNAKMQVVHLDGANRADMPAIAAAACAHVGLNLYELPASALPDNSKETIELLRLWDREAALNASALYLDLTGIDANDKAKAQSVWHFIEQIQGRLIIGGGELKRQTNRRVMMIAVEKPAANEQAALWQSGLKTEVHNLDTLVSQFNLSARTISAVSSEIRPGEDLGPVNSEEGQEALFDALWNACRLYTRPKVDELAQRIEPVAQWDDLILPPAQKRILREIISQVKHRKKVYEDWGFAAKGARGLGISALFSGDSGTGKTMASEVLANELRLDLYRIDLSQVVNKYIGETEKNLKRIFDAAEEGGAILLFDEADALFGKRSDVKDSHDRYSNIEVSYLLQRMEAYQGLAILTTNMRSALDDAFSRRLRFSLHFAFPDAKQRQMIWQRVFPDGVPLNGLDFEGLSWLNLTGGNIKNIAMNAAFIAAEEKKPLQMSHLQRAARIEYDKLEKAMSSNEMAIWR